MHAAGLIPPHRPAAIAYKYRPARSSLDYLNFFVFSPGPVPFRSSAAAAAAGCFFAS
jgi:hypothetical protein